MAKSTRKSKASMSSRARQAPSGAHAAVTAPQPIRTDGQGEKTYPIFVIYGEGGQAIEGRHSEARARVIQIGGKHYEHVGDHPSGAWIYRHQ